MSLTKEQLEFRRCRIGASDASIIMGVSPYKSAYDLWLEKKTGILPETTRAMQYGIDNEANARSLFEEMTGLVMFSNHTVTNPKRNWQFATLDGIDLEHEHILEVKCSNEKDHELAKKGTVPEKYFPQVQHQLEVTGLNKGFYFSYHKGEGIIVKTERDSAFIKDMNAKEEHFYYEHMMKGIAPEQPEKEMCSLEWDLAVMKYKEIQKELKRFEEEEKFYRDELISLSGGASCFGRGLYLTKYEREGMVDYKKIPELKGINLDLYRKPSTSSWRITVKGE